MLSLLHLQLLVPQRPTLLLLLQLSTGHEHWCSCPKPLLLLLLQLCPAAAAASVGEFVWGGSTQLGLLLAVLLFVGPDTVTPQDT
jgi:hypothetical protein